VLVGLLISCPVIVAAAFAPSLAPHDPAVLNIKQRFLPPGPDHLMGTDHAGRDVLSRVIHGARTSVAVGAASLALGLIVGVTLGALVGYVRGVWDVVLMRLIDALLAFPALLLALVLVVVLGSGVVQIMLAIAVIRIPVFARTVRAFVLAEREKEYVEAARSVGQYEAVILARHIVPNVISSIIVLGASYFAAGIVVEASLSFLGLGVVAPDVSWGMMLSESRQYMQLYPWTVIFPALALSTAVLGLNLLGDGLRDLLDPRLRTSL
jgi:ABC-type dipeptide/oligopeptide/nickel transport system permease subunit